MYHLVSFRTEIISAQASHQFDAMTGALTPAIHPSSTYVRDEKYQLIDSRHSYGRAENPGYVDAENILAELEGGPAAYRASPDTTQHGRS